MYSTDIPYSQFSEECRSSGVLFLSSFLFSFFLLVLVFVRANVCVCGSWFPCWRGFLVKDSSFSDNFQTRIICSLQTCSCTNDVCILFPTEQSIKEILKNYHNSTIEIFLLASLELSACGFVASETKESSGKRN